MTAEAAFSATCKSPKGDLFTVRGDSYPEFQANVTALLGAAATDFLSGFSSAFAVPTPAQAIGNVQQAGLAPVVPLPVPQANAAPVAAGAENSTPPMGGGNCAHGPRVYKDTMARGKPWRRYECALPWQQGADNSQRCKAVNV